MSSFYPQADSSEVVLDKHIPVNRRIPNLLQLIARLIIAAYQSTAPADHRPTQASNCEECIASLPKPP
jgi:hypothetical protein